MASAHLSIGIILISWLAGFLSYYLISNRPKTEKKLQLQELSSQLINLVLFIWLGKILLNLSVFVKDPLVILAYPSNASALYLAVFFTAITIAYKAKKREIDVLGLVNSFILVFLVASFVYEFIQFVWNDNVYSVRYIILLALLMIVFLYFQDRIPNHQSISIALIGWTVGTLGLAFVMPFVRVFGYTIAPSFLVLFCIICLALLIFQQRRKVI